MLAGASLLAAVAACFKTGTDRVFFVNYVALTGLALVCITIAVVLACILPWLPRIP
jgi:hypothetical protein